MIKIVVFLTFILPSICFGQTLVMDANNDSSGKKRNPWQTQVNLTASTSVATPSDYTDYLDTSVAANLRYRFDSFVVSAFLSGVKSLQGPRRSRFNTAFVQVSSRLSPLSNSFITTIGRARLTMPVNVDRRRDNSFEGAASLGLTSIISPDFLKSRSLTLIWSGAYTKNSHQWEITRNFARNTSHALTNFLALSYQFSDQITIDGSFSNTTRLDYRNSQLDDVYSLGQSITYLISKTSSVTVGHETGGRSYGYTGNDLDIDLFSTRASSFYINLGLIF